MRVGTPDINNFDFLVSGPPCISGDNYPLSFGVGFNGNYGCQLKDLAGIMDVEWQVICSNPHQVAYNAGIYTCSNSSYVDNAGIRVSFSYPSQPYVITFLYRVRNACGWSDWSPGNYHFIQSCSGGWSFTASPNPTNSTLSISVDIESMKGDKAAYVKQIHIMNKFGKIVKQFKFGTGTKKTSINISELKPDVYLVRVFNGKEWKGKQIIKK